MPKTAEPTGANTADQPATRRRNAVAWTIAAFAMPVLVIVGVYLSDLLFRDSVSVGDLLVYGWLPAAAAIGACIAQALRHNGREPHWILSMIAGFVLAWFAWWAGFMITANLNYPPEERLLPQSPATSSSWEPRWAQYEAPL
jgi:hypothetical protein